MTYSMNTKHLIARMREKSNEERCAKVIELAKKVYEENRQHNIKFICYKMQGKD